MSKSINEINAKLNILNKKYKQSGLTDGKISKSAAASTIGKKNVESGLLKKISILGSSKGGKANIKTGHMDKLNKVSSKNRSERRKKKIDKQTVLNIIDKFAFNKDRAIALGVTQVTLRRILKDYNLYKKETGAERMLKVYSKEQRSDLLNSHKNKK